MNWINGIIITFISKLEWGTVADWVSGFASMGAIVFAYLQIAEQRKEYKKDKKDEIRREILANRPYFSMIQLFYLTKGKDHLWTLAEDRNDEKINGLFLGSTNTHYEFKNGICAYEFKNVSPAVATNVVLKVEYQNEAKDKVLKTDYCNIGTCVIGNERAIILPHSIVNESDTYAYCPKIIYFYFSTIDDKVYRQSWINQYNELDGVCIESLDYDEIKEVPIEEMPTEGATSRSDIN